MTSGSSLGGEEGTDDLLMVSVKLLTLERMNFVQTRITLVFITIEFK